MYSLYSVGSSMISFLLLYLNIHFSSVSAIFCGSIFSSSFLSTITGIMGFFISFFITAVFSIDTEFCLTGVGVFLIATGFG